jgi:hypothetical protein
MRGKGYRFCPGTVLSGLLVAAEAALLPFQPHALAELPSVTQSYVIPGLSDSFSNPGGVSFYQAPNWDVDGNITWRLTDIPQTTVPGSFYSGCDPLLHGYTCANLYYFSEGQEFYNNVGSRAATTVMIPNQDATNFPTEFTFNSNVDTRSSGITNFYRFTNYCVGLLLTPEATIGIENAGDYDPDDYNCDIRDNEEHEFINVPRHDYLEQRYNITDLNVQVSNGVLRDVSLFTGSQQNGNIKKYLNGELVNGNGLFNSFTIDEINLFNVWEKAFSGEGLDRVLYSETEMWDRTLERTKDFFLKGSVAKIEDFLGIQSFLYEPNRIFNGVPQKGELAVRFTPTDKTTSKRINVDELAKAHNLLGFNWYQTIESDQCPGYSSSTYYEVDLPVVKGTTDLDIERILGGSLKELGIEPQLLGKGLLEPKWLNSDVVFPKFGTTGKVVGLTRYPLRKVVGDIADPAVQSQALGEDLSSSLTFYMVGYEKPGETPDLAAIAMPSLRNLDNKDMLYSLPYVQGLLERNNSVFPFLDQPSLYDTGCVTRFKTELVGIDQNGNRQRLTNQFVGFEWEATQERGVDILDKVILANPEPTGEDLGSTITYLKVFGADGSSEVLVDFANGIGGEFDDNNGDGSEPPNEPDDTGDNNGSPTPKAVPEPGTLLGLAAVSAMGIATRRKRIKRG